MSLTVSNFFQYYMFHPEQAPKSEEKILSWVMSVALGILTAGIAHLICYAALYQKNIETVHQPNPLQKKTDQLFKSTLENVQKQASMSSLTENHLPIKSSVLSRETKSNLQAAISPQPTSPSIPLPDTNTLPRLNLSVSESSLTDSENAKPPTPRPPLKEHPVPMLNINEAIKAQTGTIASSSPPLPAQPSKKKASPSNQMLPKSIPSTEETPSLITSIKEPPVAKPRPKKNKNNTQNSNDHSHADVSIAAKTHRPEHSQATSSSNTHKRKNTLNRSLSWDTPPSKLAEIVHNEIESKPKPHKKTGLKLPSFKQLFTHQEKKEEKPVLESKKNTENTASHTKSPRKRTKRWSYSVKPEDGVRKMHKYELEEAQAQKKN